MKSKRTVLGFMLVFFLMVFSPIVSQGAVTKASVTPVIKTDKSSYTVGDKVTLSTPTIGEGYKYKFVWSKDNWKEWGVISNFSFNSKASYMLKKAGTYDFYLDVRDNFGNTFSVNKKVNVAPIKPVINTDKSSYTVGDKVNISTLTTKAGYKYKFVWSRDNWKEWGVISNFSFNSKASYMLKKAGTYDFYLDVRDNFGNTFSVNKKVTVSPLKPVINTDKSSYTYTVGEKITLSTPTTKAGYKYKFVWSKDNWKEWGVISDFSFNSKASYMLKKAGTYDFYLDVRDNFGNTFSVNKKVNVAPIKPIIKTDKSSYTVGDKVNISTPTTGEGYKYKFVWSKDNWKEWGVIGNPYNNSAVTCISTQPGTYDFYLDITDGFDNVFSTSKKITVLPITPVLNTDKSVYNVGETVSLSTPTVGNGFQYRFRLNRDNGQEQKIISGFGITSRTTYTFDGAGSYDFYLDVKDSNGNVFSTSKKITVLPITPVLNTDKSVYNVGETVSLSTPTVGNGYQYRFRLNRDNGQEQKIISGFGIASRTTYTLDRSGSYYLSLEIKDKNGKVSSTGKTITADYPTIEEQMCGYVNEYRRDNGLAPLNPTLNMLAQVRANELVIRYDVDHLRPDGRKNSTVFNDYGVPWNRVGENIAKSNQYYYLTARDVTNGWIGSERHNDNILSTGFKNIGVGHAYANGTHYWVQVFSD